MAVVTIYNQGQLEYVVLPNREVGVSPSNSG